MEMNKELTFTNRHFLNPQVTSFILFFICQAFLSFLTFWFGPQDFTLILLHSLCLYPSLFSLFYYLKLFLHAQTPSN